LPKLSDAGVTFSSGTATVPVPVTAGDAPPPLEVKLTFPEYVAADVGLNRIVTFWLAPAARENEAPLPEQEPETTTQNPDAAVETLPASVPPPVF
jgi:hypothetical protein